MKGTVQREKLCSVVSGSITSRRAVGCPNCRSGSAGVSQGIPGNVDSVEGLSARILYNAVEDCGCRTYVATLWAGRTCGHEQRQERK
jgi:hypothetical protein